MSLFSGYSERRAMAEKMAQGRPAARPKSPQGAGAGYYYRGQWVSTAQAVTEDSSVLLRMADQLPINVMLAEAETLNVIYLNETARSALQTVDGHLTRPAAEVKDGPITLFHTGGDADGIAEILTTPDRLPHTVIVTAGDEVVRITYSALMSDPKDDEDEPRYLGPICVFQYITRAVRRTEAFEAGILSLIDTVDGEADELRDRSHSVSAGVADTLHQVDMVTRSAEQTTGNVQTAAAAAEQVTASIREIARQVQDSTAVARGAVGDAESTKTTIDGLSDKVNRIGDIVKLITEIAEQTNLLALNATIEAARAGEAGKGFAVVAQEVKTLAGQTNKATDEIAGQISAIQDSTKAAVSSIRGVVETIDKISQITGSIAAAVEQQEAATTEIAKAVEQAASGSGEVSDAMDSIRSASGKTGDQAEALQALSDQLVDQTTDLRNQAQEYLSGLRG